MARRNSRMSKFNRARISKIENIVKDKSPDNKNKRASMIKNIKIGAKNQELRVNSGWVTDKGFNKQRSQKELYQTIHSTFLSLPKRRNEKFDEGINLVSALIKTESSMSQTQFKNVFTSND